jgi:hypothetical protein
MGGELSFACRRLINSGCRARNTAILFQLIQQLAGFADGQIFGYISVKPLVHQLLRVDPVATRQAVDRLELVGRQIRYESDESLKRLTRIFPDCTLI